MSFQSSAERNRALGRYLAICNRRRCHMALAGRTPYQQLALLRATECPEKNTHLGRSLADHHLTLFDALPFEVGDSLALIVGGFLFTVVESISTYVISLASSIAT